MKSNFTITCPPSGDFSLQPEDFHSCRYSNISHETVMETSHGLRGPESEQTLIRRPATDYSRSEGNNLVYSALYVQEPPLEWHQMHPMTYQYQMLENSYQLSPRSDEGKDNNVFIRDPNETFAFEYTRPQSHELQTPPPTSSGPGFESGYPISSLPQNYAHGLTELDGLDNAIPDMLMDYERFNLSHNPKMSNQVSCSSSLGFQDMPAMLDTSSSKTSDDGEGESGDGSLSTVDGRISDAPYAKLIYKALMEAPNHSMVLQDIYQWFIDNTEKGRSTSTGWRNSIRHNLSMNAAFRKTSRKSNEDDSKKTSEWVLEPFAIMDGVTPTTRYRKNGKKSSKSRNSVSRVRSGRSAGNPGPKKKSQSQQSAGSLQDMAVIQHQHLHVHERSPLLMDELNVSPCTRICHQILPGGLSNPDPSSLDSWEQYPDFTSIQMEDRGVFYINGHEIHDDGYSYIWKNSQ